MPGVEGSGKPDDGPVLRTDEQGRVFYDMEHPQDMAERRLNPDMGTETDDHWESPPQPDAAPPLDLDLVWSEVIASKPLTVHKNDFKPEGSSVEGRNAAILVRELQYHIITRSAFAKRDKASPSLHDQDFQGSTDDGKGEESVADAERKDGTLLEERNAMKDTAEAKHKVDKKVENDAGEKKETPGEDKVEKEEGESEAKQGEKLAEENEKDPTEWGPLPEDDESIGKSIYGASILLRLQFEDRKHHKAVPRRTSEELALFISDITMKLEDAFVKNPKAAQEVIDAIALDLTGLLFCRYLDGMETGTTVLEECCYSLLTLCSKRANAKEMHMAIKAFQVRITKVYLEATAYLLLQPLLVIWGNVIVRIARKRKKFLTDYTKVFEQMHTCATSYQTTFVPDDGTIGVEKHGRILRIPDVLIEFFQQLIKQQLLQRETDTSISLQVDELGRAIAAPKPVERSTSEDSATKEEKDEGKKGEEKKDEEKKNEALKDGAKKEGAKKDGAKKDGANISEETLDWVGERGVTVAQLLQVLGMLWTRLSPPLGEERNMPKSKAKKLRKDRAGSEYHLSAEERELSLAKCIEMFNGLGWSNPVLVCQLGTNGMKLERVSRDGDLIQAHIGEDVRSKKEKKNTLYSVSSIAHYICSVVRFGTRSRMAGGVRDSRRDDFEVDLAGSAFDLLEPGYALDLVLPYLMGVIAQAAPAVSMGGLNVLRGLLERIPDGHYKTYDELLRLRIGQSSMGRDCSVLGLAHHVCRAVGTLDDPKHRRVAYETLQSLLRKCGHLPARFVVVESLFYETKRGVVAGQLMKEMKDTLQLMDKASWDGDEEGELCVKEVSGFRTRFAHNCFGKYFVPKKEMLATMNPMVSASSFLMFMAVSDRRMLEKVQDEEVKSEIERRLKFCKLYGRLGKECIRAFGALAEHDRRNLPTSLLAEKSRTDAMAVFAASGRTLNQCVSSLSFLESALEACEGV